MLMMKSTSPRSTSSMTQPPRPAGVRAPATVSEADRGLVGRVEHLVGENMAGLRQAPGVEGLKAVVDELSDGVAPARPVVFDRFSRKVVPGRLARRPRRSVGHTPSSIAPVTCRSPADRPKSLDSGRLPERTYFAFARNRTSCLRPSALRRLSPSQGYGETRRSRGGGGWRLRSLQRGRLAEFSRGNGHLPPAGGSHLMTSEANGD